MDPSTQTSDTDDRTTLTDPESLLGREDIDIAAETNVHEDSDHCGIGNAGRAVAGVQNDEGEFLVLVNEEIGIAIMPNAVVDEGGDWAATARDDVEATTGISIAIDDVEAIRDVDHRMEEESDPHTTTWRVLFRARPTGGGIQDCKQSADAGSDDWRADWVQTLPDGIDPAPEGGPRADLQWFLD